jgi:uncharacterized membrane protein YhhN
MLVDVGLASLVAAAVLVLLYATRAGERGREVLSKTVASVGFVILGIVRWTPGDTVGAWLVAGLVLCAAGDVFLLGDRTFDLGLATFLLGHLAYVGGFRAALPFSSWPTLVLVPLVVAGAIVASWLWPRLGPRRLPVVLYIVAISAMVWGAVSTLVRAALPWTATVGAVLFYLSDLAVARDRFVKSSFPNRALGLPAYYLGQLFLAFTIGRS